MTHRQWTSAAAVLIALTLGPTSTFAQGVQTGIITGTVTSEDGLSLPGATVTVTAPTLQGARSAVTDVNGNYVIRGLPPGDYEASIEMSGMRPRKEQTVVALGRTTTVDARLSLAGVAEAVQVVAQASPVVESPIVGANYRKEEIDRLPAGRTPQEIAELAPGLTDNTPNAGQLSISGGFAFDNVFLIDGVDVNDNFFADVTDVFIEDAVDETQVLTSGISAEYGRFSGGVVNLITKRGGNQFLGQLPHELLESGLDRRDTVRDHGPPRRSAAGVRRHARRSRPSRQGLVLCRGPLAEERDAVQLPHHAGARISGRGGSAHRRQGHRDAVRQPYLPGQLRRQRHAADRSPRHQRVGHRSARPLHEAPPAESGGRQLERRADAPSCSPRRSGRRRSSRSRTTAAAARSCATRRSGRSAATAYPRACCTTRRTSTSTTRRIGTTSN